MSEAALGVSVTVVVLPPAPLVALAPDPLAPLDPLPCNVTTPLVCVDPPMTAEDVPLVVELVLPLVEDDEEEEVAVAAACAVAVFTLAVAVCPTLAVPV